MSPVRVFALMIALAVLLGCSVPPQPVAPGQGAVPEKAAHEGAGGGGNGGGSGM